ncbi:hypothetical protein C3I27_03455 [Campylobacter jejuni]|uniref:Uncharacterized protein n=1 Tax=Campylobacter jejuni TaxID=197 RepID=A0A430VBI1_CAMJU|nr:hypothetical protein [Campylobacter jejuni]RTI48483.1 hypothetical protein C3I27_03455 [Campylobacter jejuni]RTJ79591.1 hypothetical protein C3H57_04270 [Campylobacter jejuni]HEG8097818.1 hypothetical protein [Campylobacter jejuni]
MEFNEIADRLHLSTTQVRMAYYTGVRKLRKELAKRGIKYHDYFYFHQDITPRYIGSGRVIEERVGE